MKKVFTFLIIIGILLISGVIFLEKFHPKQEKNFVQERLMEEKPLKDKKIAMVIAFRDFRDEEYFTPKQILENEGARIVTISTSEGTAIGADGGETMVNMVVDQVKAGDFDAIVFVGGPGCLKYLDNESSYRLIKETISANKVLASICISPVILAKAGVLDGKKATVWSSPLDKSGIKTLEEYGALYYNQPVVVDGKIITANGPGAAREFAQEIIRVLTAQ
ncbi:MAG TPA: DJ-1/PfpI family protein [bacterium]|nr:DJ-1/PfpI family protein [bacterium]